MMRPQAAEIGSRLQIFVCQGVQLGTTQAEMPQITVYSAMIGVDGLERRVEVTLLNPPEHSEGI